MSTLEFVLLPMIPVALFAAILAYYNWRLGQYNVELDRLIDGVSAQIDLEIQQLKEDFKRLELDGRDCIDGQFIDDEHASPRLLQNSEAIFDKKD